MALTTVLLAVSLTVWWTAATAAMRYIDRDGTGASQSQVNSAGGGGFDWLDAGIGAATAVGLGLAMRLS